MALHYAEFDTTQANLLADLRTHILTSTDWARPNAGSKPSLYKATTTRGADMIFDLEDAAITLNLMTIGVWRAHDGTTGTDKMQRWLYFRTNTTGAVATMPLHCIVSLSKEHVFISVEGPRPNETGPTSTQVGSLRNYFFMCDVVPYHAADTTPIVVAGGGMAATAAAHISSNSHQINLSRNFVNTASWSVAKLLTLDFPTCSSSETIQVTRQASGDGKYYLFPYVVIGDESGLRGRLSSFFFAGYNFSDTPEIAVPPVGSKVTYGGQTYRLLAVSKGDGTSATWAQFGAAANSSVSTYYKTPVVAVPCLP